MVEDWGAYAKGVLRAEMQKRGVSYADLVAKLETLGVESSEASLRNKVSRGGFSAAFLLQCMAAMGVMTLHLDHA